MLTSIRVGAYIAVSGFGLAAAGLLPRIDISRVTNLAGGNYDNLIGESKVRGWQLNQALFNLLDSEFVPRRVYIGTAVITLALIAPVLAKRRFAVPYFYAVSFFTLNLILISSWFSKPFYLIPRFEELHTHSSYRILGAVLIAPVMLAAATIDRLVNERISPRLLLIVPLPGIIYGLFVRPYLNKHASWLPFQVWFVLLVTTAIVGGVITVRLGATIQLGKRCRLNRLEPFVLRATPWILVLLLLADSTGKDIVDALRGTSSAVTLSSYLQNQDVYDQREQVYTACSDPGGAGEYLTEIEGQNGVNPVRYFGFDPVSLRWEHHAGTPYHAQMRSGTEQALLTGTRATCLDLYDLQGYSPMQLQRYVDLLVAINGVRLNYHDAAILDTGIESPLLNLLNPKYVITPLDIPADRHDLQYVQANMTQVYSNDVIRVFENPKALPHAWLTHDVRQMNKEDILAAIQSGSIDPAQTALVEREAPVVQTAKGVDEAATFTSYKPDEMSIDVTAGSNGFLVISEMYAPGWNAYVDGKKVDILATDYVLRGIPISAGDHVVELRYELRSLTVGFWTSIIVGMIVLILLAANAWELWTGREIRYFRMLA